MSALFGVDSSLYMGTRKTGPPEPGEPATDRATGARLRASLQVWIPRLGGDLGRPEVARDALRAYAAWEGDLRVWRSPEFERLVRWRRFDWTEVAVPAEVVERVDVYHIGADGRAFGHCARQYFPRGRIDGLLHAWLNVADLGGCKSVPAPASLTLEFPGIYGEEAQYDRVKISVEAGAAMPTELTSDGRIKVSWPPSDRPIPPTVFPDAESMALNPPGERFTDESGVPLVTYSDGSVGHQVINVWPGPIGLLMPALGSFGDLLAQQQMTAIAKLSTTNLELALRLAHEQAAPYFSIGRTTRAFATVYTMLLNDGPLAILNFAENVGVSANILADAYAASDNKTLTNQRLAEILGPSAEFRRALAQPIAIKRVWGALGLFWALLLEELEARRPFCVCARCGRITSGKKGKRFCGANDNPDCFHGRRAADRRRLRE